MSIKIVLTIGGSDSCAGAGIQADLKTFMSLNVYGCSVLTCVTSQNTTGVNRVDPLSPDCVGSQINAITKDCSVSALKTGMLLNRDIIERVAFELNQIDIPKLIDPVMVSRAGSVLLEEDAIDAYRELLFPQSALITPNIFEANLLSGMEIKLSKDFEKSANILISHGANAVLIKGGGLEEFKGQDFYLDSKGTSCWLKHKKIKTKNTHGSGCTLIAAITAYRALNFNIFDSTIKAKAFVEKAINNSFSIGKGPGTLCHMKNNLEEH